MGGKAQHSPECDKNAHESEDYAKSRHNVAFDNILVLLYLVVFGWLHIRSLFYVS